MPVILGTGRGEKNDDNSTTPSTPEIDEERGTRTIGYITYILSVIYTYIVNNVFMGDNPMKEKMRGSIYGIGIALILIVLLLTMAIFTPAVKGVDNPYGEKRWRWNKGHMKVIHDNGTELFVKRPEESYKYIQAEVVSEEDGWAEIKITWEEVDQHYSRFKEYWNNHNIPDVNNLTFMVKMSNNIAYFKKTDEVIGFNPFYIYNYTDYSVLGDEHFVHLNLYRKIEVSHTHWENNPGFLSFISMWDKVNYTNIVSPNYTYTYDRFSVDVTSKDHFVVDFDIMLPAEYLIDNVTTEEYVWLSGTVPDDETETWEFFESINTSAGANTDPTDEDGSTPTSSSGLPSSVLIAILAVLVTFSSVAGYLGYRKRREK